MPKRRKKRRGKRRESQQQLPRPNRGREQPLRPDAVPPTTAQAERPIASPSPDDNRTGEAADRTIVGTVLEVEREFIWIETEGTRAKIHAWELMLDIGEVPADHYAPGDHFKAFTFQMEPDPESGAPQFSIRRAAPYPNLLDSLKVDSVVANATVVNTYDVGIELDVDGVRGNALFEELPLACGESPHDRYQPGDIIHDLFAWQVHHDDRDLFLSIRRNAPDYVEALNAHSVGDVVSATVTAFQGNDGLWLDAGGVIGSVPPWELSLADGESAQDHYTVGDIVDDLLVCEVDRDARYLYLSVKRNAPGYVEALNAHSVGEVVSATVTGFYYSDILALDVGGVIGAVAPDELSLADGESAQDRYAVGGTVDGLFVWQVNPDRRLCLSVRRNVPGYVEALNAHSVGDVVSATVTAFQGNDVLWLDAGGVIGSVPPWELSLAADESAQDHYAVGDAVHNLFVWWVDRDARGLSLSVRRNAPSYVEALNGYSVGEPVVATVVWVQPDDLLLDVSGVSAVILASDLSLARGQSPLDRYAPGDTLSGFVAIVDDQSRTLALSTRRPGRAQRRQQKRAGSQGRRRGVLSRSASRRSGRRRSPVGVQHTARIEVPGVGDVVQGTVKRVTGSFVELDINGTAGLVPPFELMLLEGQTPTDAYTIGDTIKASVTHVSDVGLLSLSVRAAAATYDGTLEMYRAGQTVSGTVTWTYGEFLFIDVAGITGIIQPDELPVARDGSRTQQHHVGDAVDDVLVLRIDRDARRLVLSLRRTTKDYLTSLVKHNVGDIVTGVVTEATEWGLWLDVNGVVGRLAGDELELTDGETPHGKYSIGDTVEAFLWQIYWAERGLDLSIRRHGASYAEILGTHSVDEVVSGTITSINESGIWLRVGPLVAWISARELPLADGESPKDRYSDDDVVEARVWQVDVNARYLILSVRRLAPELMAEPVALREPISVSIVQDTDSGIIVLFKGREIQIPNYTLSLSIGARPIFEPRAPLSVVVMAMDGYGQPTVLSYRRTLDGWQTELNRLAPNMIVSDAEVIPWTSRPEGETRAMLDLGPITGFVAETERDAEAAESLMKSWGNRNLPVVITALDKAVGIAEVSHERFAARWAELAARISVDQSRQAELRRVTRDKAILDLGSGLQAEMPRGQIPTIEHAGERRRAHKGETFTVLITSKNETERIIEAEHPNQWLMELIAGDESLTCEFKEVYRGPNRRSKRRYARKVRSGLPVLRAMAALMNQKGGYVLVGIEDTDKKEGGVVGWQDSGFANQNSLKTDLGQNVRNTMLTPAAATFYDASFYVLPTGQEVLAIKCEPATVPIYIKNTLDDRHEFPLRQDAGTQVKWPLDKEEQMRELRRHFADRWPDEDPEVLWSDFQRRVRTRPSEDSPLS